MARSYGQFCTMARTLDLVGERWTLLIVRELMVGPRRFSDLLDGLPGIARNLLSARLRSLERQGLLSRAVLPPPAASRVYRLTADGLALGPALTELGRWGAERLPAAPAGSHFRARWMMFPLAYMADRDAARGVHEVYLFEVDEERFHLRVQDGSVEPRSGSSDHFDVRFGTDRETFRALFAGELDAGEALLGGRLRAEGDPEAIARSVRILAPSRPPAG